MANILTETLEEIYADATSEMEGRYDPELKKLLSSILEDCECDGPLADIDVQMEGLANDIARVHTRLRDAVASKLMMKP